MQKHLPLLLQELLHDCLAINRGDDDIPGAGLSHTIDLGLDSVRLRERWLKKRKLLG